MYDKVNNFFIGLCCNAALLNKSNFQEIDGSDRYSYMAITTVLMMKRVFNLPLRILQGVVDSMFTLMALPLR
ncbi:hypothetical protein KP22_19925 [Pectobacterium betavasculorum]|uniref:Transposase DDE domain-containing protein n=1 Tax=Pectobacterium betavasculorum TaxID=55207 RepID=A0A093SW37_9GAMM|nr:hypothetical protein KP22_19925 [Pectobacterium betavasculorum]KFX14316.1 hypothetical protein JV35_19240 [Pectobacterium betavasculorum]